MASLMTYPVILTDAYQIIAREDEDSQPVIINCLRDDLADIQDSLKYKKMIYTASRMAFKVMDERSLMEIVFPLLEANMIMNPKVIFVNPFLPENKMTN